MAVDFAFAACAPHGHQLYSSMLRPATSEPDFNLKITKGIFSIWTIPIEILKSLQLNIPIFAGTMNLKLTGASSMILPCLTMPPWHLNQAFEDQYRQATESLR